MKEESGHGLGPTRARVLRHLLSSHKAQPISTIATELDLHPNTIRFHLEALEERGYVHHIDETRTGKGRPRKLFAATAQAPDVDTSHLRDLTQVLIRHVVSNSDTPQETAREIGFDWGTEVATAEQAEQPEAHEEEAVSEVLAHTRDIGFVATQVDEETAAFHSCPYRSMGQPTLENICAIHYGLLRGYLEETGSPVELESLTPGDVCIGKFSPRKIK